MTCPALLQPYQTTIDTTLAAKSIDFFPAGELLRSKHTFEQKITVHLLPLSVNPAHL